MRSKIQFAIIVMLVAINAWLFASHSAQAEAPQVKEKLLPGDCAEFASSGNLVVTKCIDPSDGAVIYFGNAIITLKEAK